MAETNFKIFAESATDVMTDSEYERSTQRTGGVTPGIAEASMHNKLYRQATIMGAALAQVLVERGFNAKDNDYPGLVAALKQALVFSVNDKKANANGNVDYKLLSISEIYPVNSIMITADGVNPGTRSVFAGTTWQALGAGRTLVGAGRYTDSAGNQKTFVGGDTGGEYAHTLTSEEMPVHGHDLTIASAGAHKHNRGTMNITGRTSVSNDLVGYGDGPHTGAFYYGGEDSTYRYANDRDGGSVTKVMFDASRSWVGETSLAGAHDHAGSKANDAGGNQAHNNMQPYITVYFWQRIA